MLTSRLLYRIARACNRDRLVTVVSEGGRRFGAWPYGVVSLPPGVLDVPDGTWRLHRAKASELHHDEPDFTPGFVRREVLPRLAQPGRVRVFETPVIQPAMRLNHRHDLRMLSRSDGAYVAFCEDLWKLWRQTLPDLSTWQAGDRPTRDPIVWAVDAETPAEALLLPVWSRDPWQVPQELVEAAESSPEAARGR